MAWTAPMIHALLLRAPTPKLPAPLRVAGAARPMRAPSGRQVAAQTKSGYAK